MDFISCCNLLIYFDIGAQKKALRTFHYSLNNDGYLMLGKSENINQSTQLFTSANKKYKIFSRKINSDAQRFPELSPRFAQQSAFESSFLTVNQKRTTKIFLLIQGLDDAIDEVLVAEFMPASVVINHQ
ncbi:MAG: hypothetical protein IPN15_22730 [Saprospiraceae bacterium]|nr:hypothetical protein [Candidatus Vicinibacter affinis]